MIMTVWVWRELNLYAEELFGGRTSDVLGIASKEGSYAANALGIDIGTYIQRRTELTRAGKREVGALSWQKKILLVETRGSILMAAERLYGISPSAINRLQGSLRFGDENTSYGLVIIREFERGMKELKRFI